MRFPSRHRIEPEDRTGLSEIWLSPVIAARYNDDQIRVFLDLSADTIVHRPPEEDRS